MSYVAIKKTLGYLQQLRHRETRAGELQENILFMETFASRATLPPFRANFWRQRTTNLKVSPPCRAYNIRYRQNTEHSFALPSSIGTHPHAVLDRLAHC
ncbi:hypothetical protein E2C01_031810 [Portunus trituberculatus]|uniref:Uncharacterized protein n=1 Tax=Portunus trituberculatus TaxID=210409 RepID=A0A5B7F130_PORTR|nr:hypothetical protein [Portunus trituberculatus]